MASLVQFDASDKKRLKEFVDFGWYIYKDDKYWVPPLKSDMKKMLIGEHNTLFKNGIHTFFVAYEGNKLVGRIVAGIDEKLNKLRNKKQGYFALFECIDDQDVANMLFDAAFEWAVQKGMDTIIGPVSPTNGEDSKGVVLNGREGQPVLLNSYNPDYYEKLYVDHGFVKDEDHLAFIFEPKDFDNIRFDSIVQAACKRYNYHIDRVDLKKVETEVRDIVQVLNEGIDDEWEYTTPPAYEDILDEFNALKIFYNGYYSFIARAGDRPIGFVMALPDYNQVLKKMNGRLFPIGWLKFLIYRRKIDVIRVFVQFAVKDYRNMGVTGALLNSCFKDVVNNKIRLVEGGLVGEYNELSVLSVLKAGGKLYRNYRVYRRNLVQKET